MGRDAYVNANRASWNEAASFHETPDSYEKSLKAFCTPGYSHLDSVQTQWLEKIGVAGKSVIQLCCNNGREILSIKNMGAERCVGVDGAEEFLNHAKQFAAAGNIDCEFVGTDIYELDESYNAQFDLCVITIGVFGWMPDLKAFFKIISRLLKPGGRLFVHEEHPIMNMVEPDDDDPTRLRYSYFRSDPFVENNIIVYDGSNPGEGKTHYWFVHTLSDIFSCCLGNGLSIDAFKEYDENISSEEFNVYEHREAQLPMSYVLVASKK